MDNTKEQPSFLMEKGWYEVLKEEFEKPYLKNLQKFLAEEKEKGKTVFPPHNLIFNAFCQTPFDKVKVVIIGQDPYHNLGQAHGLSFSVPVGIAPPPSLKNIFKELEEDLKIPPAKTGCLLPWAKQGVLLLNATLTVRKNEPKSHHNRGWETLTDAVIKKLSEKNRSIIYVLWGRSAREKCSHITKETGYILEAPHPSPYSANAGFFGCRHFSKINKILEEENKKPVDWAMASQ